MKNLLKKYFNSELSVTEFNSFSKYISNDKNKEEIFAEMYSLWIDQNSDTTVPIKENQALLDKIKLKIAVNKQTSQIKKIRLYSILYKIVALFIIALFVTNIYLFNKNTENNFSNNTQKISVPFGSTSRITLPDGSIVSVNSGSTISYNSDFINNRKINLDGEAYFEVVKSKKTFIVSTYLGDIEVKGTSFNVKAYEENGRFETTLVEGSVTIRNIDGTIEKTILPNEQAVCTSKKIKIQKVDVNLHTSWMSNILIFKEEPLNNLVLTLRRKYNVSFNFENEELLKIKFTGTIRNESISEVMSMISKTAQISCSFDKKKRIIVFKKINQK